MKPLALPSPAYEAASSLPLRLRFDSRSRSSLLTSYNLQRTTPLRHENPMIRMPSNPESKVRGYGYDHRSHSPAEPHPRRIQFASSAAYCRTRASELLTMASLPVIIVVFLCLFSIFILAVAVQSDGGGRQKLRFDEKKGEFRILQVADMHYADGWTTPCEDVLPEQFAHCSDLNTTFFIQRMIQAEKPDLIVFTGDNIYGPDATDAVASMNAAFAPVVTLNIPWAAVLGNHDQESTLSREGVMKHIVGMKHTLSRFNPPDVDVIDGFGNYNLEVHGVEGSGFVNKPILNLYFLDSGDYSTVPSIPGFGWIKPSQQSWFQQTSMKLQKKSKAPGLAYFHIPLPEYARFDSSNFMGVKQEGICSASVNSGFFTTLAEAGDVKAVFTGHDHINDFCGELRGIHLCYAGGFGYHAYGKAGWPRRARVVLVSLDKESNGSWGAVKSIRTWKRLDDKNLTAIDDQVLWSKTPSGNRRKKQKSPV